MIAEVVRECEKVEVKFMEKVEENSWSYWQWYKCWL